MEEKKEQKEISRRDLLKKTLKTAGYTVPVLMALSSLSLNAWANSYTNNNIGTLISGKRNRNRGQKPHRGRRNR